MKDTIIFKVSCELKEQLQKEAKERDMSLSSYLKSIIAERKNKMTLEEVKQKLKAFDKYTFEEDTHTYYCNGKRVGIGVTTLIGLYANKFDEQKVAEW